MSAFLANTAFAAAVTLLWIVAVAVPVLLGFAAAKAATERRSARRAVALAVACLVVFVLEMGALITAAGGVKGVTS